MGKTNKDQVPKMNKEQLEELFKKIDNNEPTWQRAVPENLRPSHAPLLATEYRDKPLPYGHFEELKADGRRLPAPPKPPAQVSAEQEPSNHFAQLRAAGANLPVAPQPPKQDHGNVHTPDRLPPTKALEPKYQEKAAVVRLLQNREMELKLSANVKESPLMAARGYEASKSLNRTNH
jgi:hypothetical protein